nr:putative late blight resistance protein homolog R1B-14 [Ipomoea batatas]
MAGVVEAFAGRLGDRLVQVVDENVSLLKEIKKQVEGLVGDIKNFDAYLEQASRNPRSNENDVLKDVVAQMWNVVIKAEDAICKYTVEKKKHKDKGWLRYFQSPAYYSRITASAKEIKAIRDDFKEIWESNAAALQALTDDHGEAQPAIPVMAPVVEEVDVVGFDSEAKLIKDLLIKGPADLTVISIEGMVGLGKTTLTKMVFNDRDLQYEFFTRLWVYVSRTVNRRQIFLDILSNFTKNTEKFQGMLDDKLVDKIKYYLEGGKYFIVVDDVWTERDWDCLQIAFPNNQRGSRVLLTTRLHNVASHAASSGNPHQLKFLSNDESWELLKKKVFRQEICPPG